MLFRLFSSHLESFGVKFTWIFLGARLNTSVLFFQPENVIFYSKKSDFFFSHFLE